MKLSIINYCLNIALSYVLFAPNVNAKENTFKVWFGNSIYQSEDPAQLCGNQSIKLIAKEAIFTEADIVKSEEAGSTWLIKKSNSQKSSELINRCFTMEMGSQSVIKGVALSKHSARLIKGNLLTIENQRGYLKLKLYKSNDGH